MNTFKLLTSSCSILLTASMVSAQVTIQFGGDAGHLTDGTRAVDANWASAIGADQIIQWNGVNSDGGSFGSAGTLVKQGVGATLTSVGAESLVLTTTGLSAADTTGIQTDATASPNFLGVDSGTDNNAPQFEGNFSEVWTLNFDQDVTWSSMVSTAMGFDGERFGVDIGADGSNEFEWNRTGFTVGTGTVSAVDFGGNGEYMASFGTAISIPAGTDVSIKGLQGSVGLEALVVTTVPEPSTYAVLFGVGALGLVLVRRKVKGLK